MLIQHHPLICLRAQVAFDRTGALWTAAGGIDQADVLLGVALEGGAGLCPVRCVSATLGIRWLVGRWVVIFPEAAPCYYRELAGNVADDEAEQQELGIGSEMFGGVVA